MRQWADQGDVDRNDANVPHEIELVRGPTDFSTRLVDRRQVNSHRQNICCREPSSTPAIDHRHDGAPE